MAAPNLDRAREQVAAACGRLAEERLVVGTAGNVSARAGDQVAISATGAVLADATPEQVSVIDMDGRVVEGEIFAGGALVAAARVRPQLQGGD